MLLRTIALPTIAFMLITSLLAPPILSLFHQDGSMVVMLSTEDEEKGSEKEAEKKSDEQDLFLTDFTLHPEILKRKGNSILSEHVLFVSDFNPDIQVPPPRTFWV